MRTFPNMGYEIVHHQFTRKIVTASLRSQARRAGWQIGKLVLCPDCKK